MDSQITTTDYAKYIAIIVSVIALGHTMWKDHRMNKRVKKVEQEQEREKKEAEVRRSKASSPYFIPLKKMLGNIYDKSDKNDTIVWSCGLGNVLTFQHLEIGREAPEGFTIILPLDNVGKGARKFVVSSDISNVEFKQEPQIGSASCLTFLKYPYSHSQHGKKQKVILSFETEDGFDLKHTYETRHGHFEFNRIDPS